MALQDTCTTTGADTVQIRVCALLHLHIVANLSLLNLSHGHQHLLCSTRCAHITYSSAFHDLRFHDFVNRNLLETLNDVM
jgi:hypothetical protein